MTAAVLATINTFNTVRAPKLAYFSTAVQDTHIESDASYCQIKSDWFIWVYIFNLAIIVLILS